MSTRLNMCESTTLVDREFDAVGSRVIHGSTDMPIWRECMYVQHNLHTDAGDHECWSMVEI